MYKTLKCVSKCVGFEGFPRVMSQQEARDDAPFSGRSLSDWSERRQEVPSSSAYAFLSNFAISRSARVCRFLLVAAMRFEEPHLCGNPEPSLARAFGYRD